jgi:hypothetical protein
MCVISTVAAPQWELRIFNATVIYWARLNNSKICYKISLPYLKYSHCRPVHSASRGGRTTQPTAPRANIYFLCQILTQGHVQKCQGTLHVLSETVKSVVYSVTSQHGNLNMYSAVTLGQHSVTPTYAMDFFVTGRSKFLKLSQPIQTMNIRLKKNNFIFYIWRNIG